jgi:prepilin-type N-terminal cleavage/methylation domain-containing protein
MANMAAERGFTLLELMVSLAIVGITFVLLLALVNRDIGHHSHSAHLTTATLLGQERLAALELSDAVALGEWSGVFPGHDGYAWRLQVAPAFSDFVREARLLVFWHEGARREEVELTTYLFHAQ